MPTPLEPGDPAELGGYRLRERIGEGGQGIVYRADNDQWQVAIKLLHAKLARNAKARRRFLAEADAARRVARFCTAQVLSVGIEGDRPYVISEYVKGPSLYERVASHGLFAGADLDRLAVSTITALAAIHRAGIVHRDFKPGNVLLASDGPRVIDFGIARILHASASTTSQTIGTPASMAPEQITGEEVTPATDVFAWGTTMAYAASGKLPFGGDSIPAIMNRILNRAPELDVADPMRSVIQHALAKDPTDRPTAQRLLSTLLGTETDVDDSTTEKGEVRRLSSPTPTVPEPTPGAPEPVPAGTKPARTPSHITDALIEIVGEITGQSYGGVAPDQRISNLGIDSLSMVEVAVALEEEFEMRIPDDALTRLHTVRDVVDYIRAESTVYPAATAPTPIPIHMPLLGENVTEATVVRWLKREGDQVAADDPLVEISTDKVDVEVPSPAPGKLREIVVAEDETVPVGAQLAILVADGRHFHRRPAAVRPDKDPVPAPTKLDRDSGPPIGKQLAWALVIIAIAVVTIYVLVS